MSDSEGPSVTCVTEVTLPVPIECSASSASLTAVLGLEAELEIVSVRSPPLTVGRNSVKSWPWGTLMIWTSL